MGTDYTVRLSTSFSDAYSITSGSVSYIPGTNARTMYSTSYVTDLNTRILPYDSHAPQDNRRSRYVVADKNAKDLLLSSLSSEQRQMFEREDKFRVVSDKGGIFEITNKLMHNIYRLNMQGERVEVWCVWPVGELPIYDALLAQKHWLENDEEDTARYANITSAITGRSIKVAPEEHQLANAAWRFRQSMLSQ